MAVGIARCRLSDVHLAEDAAQEAFAEACRILPTLRDHERFPQWLGTICRRSASRLAKGQPAFEPLPEDQESCGDSGLAMIRLQVREALEQLDETSREIVILHYFSGLSHAEIARALDLTAPAIHGRLQRARGKLATLLNAHEPMGTKQ